MYICILKYYKLQVFKSVEIMLKVLKIDYDYKLGSDTYVRILIADVNHSVVKVRRSTTGQKEDDYADRTFFRTSTEDRCLWIFQVALNSVDRTFNRIDRSSFFETGRSK